MFWLTAGTGGSWEMGWNETWGLSPEALLCAAGTAQHPFVVAPHSWDGTGFSCDCPGPASPAHAHVPDSHGSASSLMYPESSKWFPSSINNRIER